MHTEIGIWFLVVGLFFPRITLFFWWAMGNLPHNTTPFVFDVISTIMLPRLLILMYIFENQGYSDWFFIHFVFFILSLLFMNAHVSKEKLKEILQNAD